jgi:hypothetical protein
VELIFCCEERQVADVDGGGVAQAFLKLFLVAAKPAIPAGLLAIILSRENSFASTQQQGGLGLACMR